MTAYRGAFRTLLNIYNGAFIAKIPNGFKVLTIFARNTQFQMFDWVENKLLAKGFKYWAHFCSQPTNPAEKILSKKIFVTSFLKRRKVVVGQQTERVFMQKQPSEGFFDKGVMRNFEKFTRKRLYRNPFLVFFCEFCEIWTLFLQKRTGQLLLIVVVSIVAKGVLANETVNYETRTKAYVLIWSRSVSY